MCVQKIKSIINSPPKLKAPGLDGFTGELYQTFKDEIISILYTLFQTTEAKGILPNSFYEASTTLIPKPDKDITIKRQADISHEHRCKPSTKY